MEQLPLLDPAAKGETRASRWAVDVSAWDVKTNLRELFFREPGEARLAPLDGRACEHASMRRMQRSVHNPSVQVYAQSRFCGSARCTSLRSLWSTREPERAVQPSPVAWDPTLCALW
jgi:hypothetical protein